MKVVKWLFVALALVLASRFLILWWSHNFNIAAEANDLYGTLSLVDGQALYPSRSQVPYHIYLYLPFHAYLGAGMIWLAHLHDLRWQVLLLRGMSLAALLLSFTFLWRNVIRPLGIPWLTFLAVSLLAGPKLSDYATAARNDTLALCLEMAALSIFIHWVHRRSLGKYLLFIALSLCSLWTRQSGVVFASAMIFLVLSREYWRMLATGLGFVLLNGLIYWGFYQSTHGAIVDHVFLANIRDWRSINLRLFDASLVSFLLCYLTFTALFLLGIKTAWARRESVEIKLVTIIFSLSFVFSLTVFMRAGGDVNYFFESIMVGITFACLGWERIRETLSPLRKNLAVAGLAIQVVLICGVYIAKDRSAFTIGRVDYAKIADGIKKEARPYGYVIGPMTEALNVYLRGWLYHGPDVTSSSWVSRNAHRSLRELAINWNHAMADGTIGAVVATTPGCDHWAKWNGLWGKWFDDKVVLDSGVCVYHSRHKEKALNAE